jgi:hypothetical protein
MQRVSYSVISPSILFEYSFNSTQTTSTSQGKSPDEIRKIFNISNDTPQETVSDENKMAADGKATN